MRPWHPTIPCWWTTSNLTGNPRESHETRRLIPFFLDLTGIASASTDGTYYRPIEWVPGRERSNANVGDSSSSSGGGSMLIIIIIVVVVILLVVAALAAIWSYLWWQKRKRNRSDPEQKKNHSSDKDDEDDIKNAWNNEGIFV